MPLGRRILMSGVAIGRPRSGSLQIGAETPWAKSGTNSTLWHYTVGHLLNAVIQSRTLY